MKLVSYLKDEHDQLAILENNLLYDTDLLHIEMPSSMSMFLNFWDDNYALAAKLHKAIVDKRIGKEKGFAIENADLLAPIPFASSLRCGLVKDETMQTAFYFLNHHSIQGTGKIMCMPKYLTNLYVEPQLAIVISKLGRNVPAAEAEEYIAGFMMLNTYYYSVDEADKSTRKNVFAISIGPSLVTPDDVETEEDLNLHITLRINNETVAEETITDVRRSFIALIESASYGATLYPGDVISLSSINNKSIQHKLNEDDVTETEIEGFGILLNTITKEENELV